MTEEYEPELKVWALEHFNQMAVKAVWRPEGTGCRYRKIDDQTLELEHRVDHPDSINHHERITGLFAAVNIGMVDDKPMITSAALSAEEAFMQEMQERQAVAASWTNEDGVPLASLPLELAEPVYLGEREVLLDNGETHTVEDWGVSVPPLEEESSSNVIMNPDDFNLLAGDSLFMRYKSGDNYMIAMTRQQMFDMTKTDELGVLVGSECPDTGEKVPPWMWGTYCMRVPITDIVSKSLGEEE
tara:strand:+ start:377 stop:1105 length:729 start_codon:yes stop_codon:yes gene_type:complete